MTKKILIWVSIVLFISTGLFLILFIKESRRNAELVSESQTYLNISTGLLGFIKDTSDYISCLWGAMRNEYYFSACDSYYFTYKDSRNMLADNGLVDTRVNDR